MNLSPKPDPIDICLVRRPNIVFSSYRLFLKTSSYLHTSFCWRTIRQIYHHNPKPGQWYIILKSSECKETTSQLTFKLSKNIYEFGHRSKRRILGLIIEFPPIRAINWVIFQTWQSYTESILRNRCFYFIVTKINMIPSIRTSPFKGDIFEAEHQVWRLILIRFFCFPVNKLSLFIENS